MTGIAVVLSFLSAQINSFLWMFRSVNTLNCFEMQKLVGRLNKHYIVVSFIHAS